MKIVVYEKEAVIKDLDFFVYHNKSLTQFYQDIKNAINANNTQSLWQLSKIITRHEIKDKLK
ncbi:MAG: hypothetical protein EU532_04245 [Promethearchaeota archaeon]|nr:MAG: hypothetical protein EU532_04245 [Candidatus Lokiarchaeota archaeon]